MDIRMLELFLSDTDDIKTTDIRRYNLPDDMKDDLINNIERLSNADPWEPEVYAKTNMIKTFLECGFIPELTKKYLVQFASNTRIMEPSDSGEIVPKCIAHMIRARNTEVFKNVSFEYIAYTIPKIETLYMNRRVIKKFKNDIADIKTLFRTLVKGNSSDLMAALYLYKNCTSNFVIWTKEEETILRERINEWINNFKAWYEFIAARIPKDYIFYNDKSKKVLYDCWDSCMNGEFKIFLETIEAYEMEPKQTDMILYYIKTTPHMWETTHNYTYIWNALDKHIYSANTCNPREKVYFYCLNNSSLQTFFKNCEWFYNLVMNNQLTENMILLKAGEDGADIESYKRSLAERNYPYPKTNVREYIKLILNSLKDNTN